MCMTPSKTDPFFCCILRSPPKSKRKKKATTWCLMMMMYCFTRTSDSLQGAWVRFGASERTTNGSDRKRNGTGSHPRGEIYRLKMITSLPWSRGITGKTRRDRSEWDGREQQGVKENKGIHCVRLIVFPVLQCPPGRSKKSILAWYQTTDRTRRRVSSCVTV